MDIKKFSDFENIYGCDSFLREKERLYAKDRKNGIAYDKWLHRQLCFLDTNGLDVLVTHKQAFENITSGKGIYSITRREFAGNPRILFFAIVKDGEQDLFVLLTAFNELANGSYQRAIEVAQSRRKELMEFLKEDGTDELTEKT